MAEGGRTDGANLRNRLLSTVMTQCSKSSRRVKRDSGLVPQTCWIPHVSTERRWDRNAARTASPAAVLRTGQQGPRPILGTTLHPSAWEPMCSPCGATLAAQIGMPTSLAFCTRRGDQSFAAAGISRRRSVVNQHRDVVGTGVDRKSVV